jgi:hypothetical protein
MRKKEKPGDAVGRPSGRSSLLRDPGANFFLKNGGETENKKNRCWAIVRRGRSSRRYRLRRVAGEE